MRKLLLAISMFVTSFALAQTGTVRGTVIDPDDKSALIGANVVVKGTTTGTTTDVDGRFTLSVDAGSQTLVVSYVGYDNLELNVTVSEGQTTDLGTIELAGAAIGLKEIEVIASIAVDRKTPVAVSSVKGYQIEEKVGNQEFPEVLRYTPSIYVTKQGGGVGDSRINVRGFDQRNTAVLINGVPVNDMENGWVYWSNWQGLSDVTSSMQVQRGMSASKLAISSVGGTINVITNAAEMEKGGKFGVNVGNDGFQKYSLALSTGLGKGGVAFTVLGTYSSGNGYVDGTAFKAGSYFASLAWKMNDKHSLHVTGTGAPQWHHQRTLGNFDGITIQTYEDHPRGIRYNHLWGDYNGEEFSWRRNFYHKPIVYFNWYWDISDRTELATTFYGSWGRGGGTGPRGRINGSFETSSKFKDTRYGNAPDGNPYPGQVDFQNIANWNMGSTNFPASYGAPKEPWISNGQNPDTLDNRRGFFSDKYVNTSRDGFIRRASMNAHNWYGILSTLTHEFNDNWNVVGGIDLRDYVGIHYRRVDNLLMSDAYFTRTNVNIAGEFISQEKESTALAELKNDKKLNYHNDGRVGWAGLFGQIEYSNEKLSAHLSAAASNQSYTRVDYFAYYDSDDLNGAAGRPNQVSETKSILGGNVKAGANYNINDAHNVFANAGYYSRQPLFDAVFPGFQNNVNPTLQNETVTGLELGYGFRSRFLNANVNLYSTTWSDRFLERGEQLPSGESGTAQFNNIAEVHNGIEFEFYGEIARGLRLDAMFSAGDWRYTDDVTAQILDDNQQPIGQSTLYLKDVKVGDAAQLTGRLGLTYEIVSGLRVYGSYYYADNLYARFSIAGFDDPAIPVDDRVLKLPSYDLIDLGLYYAFKVGSTDWNFKLNVNNVANNKYYAESLTNITEADRFNENIAFPGFGTTWNTGLSVRF